MYGGARRVPRCVGTLLVVGPSSSGWDADVMEFPAPDTVVYAPTRFMIASFVHRVRVDSHSVHEVSDLGRFGRRDPWASGIRAGYPICSWTEVSGVARFQHACVRELCPISTNRGLRRQGMRALPAVRS
jgi:hypothetical protein